MSGAAVSNDAVNGDVMTSDLMTSDVMTGDWAADLPQPGWDDAPAAPPQPDASALILAPCPDAAALRIALMAQPAPRLDASAVEKLPGPALQVLLAAMRDARAAGDSVVILNPSFAFSLTFEAFGFGADNEPFTVEYS
jgi:hypothetical protein